MNITPNITSSDSSNARNPRDDVVKEQCWIQDLMMSSRIQICKITKSFSPTVDHENIILEMSLCLSAT